jgi:hypothetical protein
MASVLPLDQMTLSEKLRALEGLWDDLSRTPADVPAPDWHGEVLREREKGVEEGKSRFTPGQKRRKRFEVSLKTPSDEGRNPRRGQLGPRRGGAPFADIESLAIYASIHERHFGYHRLLSKRFPYAIYYDVDGSLIRVYAVLDCRRDPERARRRLM